MRWRRWPPRMPGLGLSCVCPSSPISRHVRPGSVEGLSMTGSGGVVQNEAEGVPATGVDGADAVADRCGRPAAGGADRAVAGGEDQRLALAEDGGVAAGLGAGPL